MAFYEGYGADISIDGNALTLTKKGLAAKAIGNAGMRRISFEALVGVNFKDATRLTNGWLQLVVGGESPAKAAASDPNTVLFRYKSQAQFAGLRDYLIGVVERNQQLGLDSAAAPYDPATKTRLQTAQERQAVREDEAYLKRRKHFVNQLGGPGVAREDIVEAAASMHWTLGGGREIKKLVEHLHPGEAVRKIGQGTYHGGQGIIALTDSRLLFLFHGLTRKNLEDFPLSAISSVSTKSGLVAGDLRVFVAGNEAVISDIVNADLNPLAGAIRQEMSRAWARREQQARTESPVPITDADPLSQIARLAELRDQGILSNEEFEAKKTELLGRL